MTRRAALVILVLTAFLPVAIAAPRPRGGTDKLPLSGLAPSKLVPGLCVYKYRISTTSPECQAFFDQGLGYAYSYVWLEAIRSFETALEHDPNCAMAWWGLYRAFEGRRQHEPATKALVKANEFKDRASHREQQLIWASMQEKGQAPNVGDADARRKKAIETIDALLAQYDDDEEAWYFRAQLSGGAGGFGGQLSAVPFYKALLHVNPLHPGANHELVHFYENHRRPALGWPYAEKYIESSPGIPHAFHMQAHLGTRIGKWNKTSDYSARAIVLEKAYHEYQGVKPAEDAQYSHHLDTLLISLTHDGRFAEARGIIEHQRKLGSKDLPTWFRLYLADRDYAAALELAEQIRRRDKVTASYYSALVYLKQGDAARALPEIEVLRHAFANGARDRQEYRMWEVQGLYLCQTGAGGEGLKLLERAANRSKNDYGHHAWGNGSYLMEQWGAGALQSAHDREAEEAYLEALAHDPGSVRAALGLEVLCARQGRTEEAERYAELARKCWAKADSGKLQTELNALRGNSAAATKSEGETGKSSGRRP
jgi:Tfp pilus assembly protein PilF